MGCDHQREKAGADSFLAVTLLHTFAAVSLKQSCNSRRTLRPAENKVTLCSVVTSSALHCFDQLVLLGNFIRVLEF